MKIKIEDVIKHNFLGIAVMHIMTEHAREKDFCKVFNVVPGANSDVEVKMTINGVEVDFGHFIKELERQHNDLVERDAKEAMRARVSMMLDRLNEIIGQAEQNIIDEIEETFPGKKVW